jgi:tetratricopeptide (TPR) repeat protein
VTPTPDALDGLVQAFQAGAWSDLEARAIAITQEWPQAAIGWKALGLALLRMGRAAQALPPLDRARVVTPDDAELYSYAGDALVELGQRERALACYQAGVQVQPSAETHNRIGRLLFDLERFADAERHFACASALQPAAAPYHMNRGAALRQLDRVDDAEASFRDALALAPDDANAHYNFGNILRDGDKLDDAEQAYRRAIALEPSRVDAMANLAQTLADLGRAEEASALCRAAIERRADYALAHWNKSLIDLRLSNFAEGWRGYEWRWRYSGFPTPRRTLRAPLWLGEEPLAGRTIAVAWEQGLGDTIQFCRYLPMLAEKGARVLFAPQGVLRGLMTGLAGKVELVSLEDLVEGRCQYDYQLPLLSLPLAFATDVGTIPASVPYLRAEPDRVARWRGKIGEHGFKIGICWQGRPGKDDRGRAFQLASFAGIARLPGVRLISLHKGAGEAQLDGLPEGMVVEVPGDSFDSGPDAFLDSAAIMQSLDLVITSDTAVAHLAGALGVRTWVALKAVADWRWMMQGQHSPWYPTMRLFRQSMRGDWSTVFAEIERALELSNPG